MTELIKNYKFIFAPVLRFSELIHTLREQRNVVADVRSLLKKEEEEHSEGQKKNKIVWNEEKRRTNRFNDESIQE